MAAPVAAHDGHEHDLFAEISPTIRSGLFSQGLFNDPSALDAPLGQSRAAAAKAPAGGGTGEARPLRVYVVVVDGLRPQEVGDLTPTLKALRDGGTWYEQPRTVFPGETLPAHAAMMTGVLPRRNGIIANQFYRGDEPKEYMQHPSFLDADTLTTRLERSYGGAISTATVLSKQYLYGLFLGERAGPGDDLPQRKADFHWDPRSSAAYVPNPSDHALDAATMGAFREWVAADPPLPQFGFVNLGDVDRAGHADESGALFAGERDEPMPAELTSADVSPFRQAAIEDTDTQIGLLVDQLKAQGAWDETVLIVLSDHGMDWGLQNQYAPIRAELSRAGYSGGQYQLTSTDYMAVGGGGSELIYVRHEGDIAPIARAVAATEGVEFVATREPIPGLDNPTHAELGIDHPRTPDVEAFMESGYRSSPFEQDNPLPGNHGNSITQHSALMVAGGHPFLDDAPERVPGETVYDPQREKLFVDPAGGPGVVSVAPTVASLFGIGEPEGGYDTGPLAEAFEPAALDQPPPAAPKKQRAEKTRGKEPPPPPPADPAPLLTVGVDVTRATLTDATYSLLVANRGSETAPGVVLTNAVPANTTFASATRAPLPPTDGGQACAAGAAAGTTCTWAIGDLAPGAQAIVDVTYALAERDGEYSVANTAAAQAAGGGGGATDTDRSLGHVSHVLEDMHVDDSRPGANFGACDRFSLRGDNGVTAFLDDDLVGTNWAAGGGFGGWQAGRPETLWAAEVRATVASAPSGIAAPVALHRATQSWAEGSGPCAGTDGAGEEPQAASAPAAAATVSGPGPVSWDVAPAIDTEDERVRFAGFELRAADASLPAGETLSFHSSEATTAADRPRLVAVLTHAEPSRCIDADAETGTARADGEQRVTAYVTDGVGTRVSNGGEDGCNGTPVPGQTIGWDIDDDAPDAYISKLDGSATRREVGPSGDAAPNSGSTRSDAAGTSFISVRLGDPLTDLADAENRIAAVALKRYYDGKAAPAQGYPGDGACEPGNTTNFGLFACEGILGVPGVLGQPTPGESDEEDDVRRAWSR